MKWGSANVLAKFHDKTETRRSIWKHISKHEYNTTVARLGHNEIKSLYMFLSDYLHHRFTGFISDVYHNNIYAANYATPSLMQKKELHR